MASDSGSNWTLGCKKLRSRSAANGWALGRRSSAQLLAHHKVDVRCAPMYRTHFHSRGSRSIWSSRAGLSTMPSTGIPIRRTLKIPVFRGRLPAFAETMLGSGIKSSKFANERLFASATSRIAPGAYRPLDLWTWRPLLGKLNTVRASDPNTRARQARATMIDR
jgi:hypothetical protein